MCLLTKQKRFALAKKDIECYKIIECVNPREELEHYRTPYMLTEISKRVVDGKDYFRATKTCNFNRMRLSTGDRYRIGDGAVHCFFVKELAVHYFCVLRSCDAQKYYKLFKCVIPKCTRYAISTNGDEICAKKIKFVEEVL